MVEFIASCCFLGFLGLSLLSPLLPLFLAWRMAALASFALIAMRLTSGPVHHADQGPGYFLLLLMIVGGFGIIAVGLALRIAIRAARRAPRPAPPAWRRWIDLGLLAIAGSLAGVAAAQWLAYALGGGAGGRALDIGLAGLAGLTAVAAAGLGRRGRGKPATAIAAACLSFAAIAAAGSGQASRVVDGAERFAEGRPWCLLSPAGNAPITSHGRLGFFSLPKKGAYPHLVLLMRDGEGLAFAHWSIRRQQFFGGVPVLRASCAPRPDFARALQDGAIDPRRLAIGPHVYAVPATFSPHAGPMRLVLHGDMLLGPNEDRRPWFSRITLDHAPQALRMPEGARPLASMPSVTQMPAFLATQRGKFEFAGTAQDGERQAALSCFDSAASGRLCLVRVAEGGRELSFFLPAADLPSWRWAADGVVAPFESLRERE